MKVKKQKRTFGGLREVNPTRRSIKQISTFCKNDFPGLQMDLKNTVENARKQI